MQIPDNSTEYLLFLKGSLRAIIWQMLKSLKLTSSDCKHLLQIWPVLRQNLLSHSTEVLRSSNWKSVFAYIFPPVGLAASS